MKVKAGFTGTRDGMKGPQRKAFVALIGRLGITHFAHGDCVGSDDEAATLVDGAVAGVHIICHPPMDESLRAFNNKHDEMREPKTHFARNRAIVDESDFLIATPREMEHQARGGTWYTVDYARKRGKRVFVVCPDGSVQSDILFAPWTPEQVAALNAHQQRNDIHPYTCGGNRKDANHLDGEGVLVATPEGWVCPYCDYRQGWAVAGVGHDEAFGTVTQRGLP